MEQTKSAEAEGVETAEIKESADLDNASPRESSANREETLEERVEAPAKRHHSKSSKKSNAKNDGERKYDTIDGAVAIIYYEDEDTGKIYFSLERKSRTHPSKGKYALWGGTVKVGEPHIEALVRELSEEDPKGYSVVLKALKNNGYKLTELVERVDGQTSRTSVYVAKIKGADKWGKYISAKTSLEGERAILSFGEVVAAINGHYFAYPLQAGALEMLLKTGLQEGPHKSHNSYTTSFFKTQISPYQTYTASQSKTQSTQLETTTPLKAQAGSYSQTYTTSQFKAQNVKL